MKYHCAVFTLLYGVSVGMSTLDQTQTNLHPLYGWEGNCVGNECNTCVNEHCYLGNDTMKPIISYSNKPEDKQCGIIAENKDKLYGLACMMFQVQGQPQHPPTVTFKVSVYKL